MIYRVFLKRRYYYKYVFNCFRSYRGVSIFYWDCIDYIHVYKIQCIRFHNKINDSNIDVYHVGDYYDVYRVFLKRSHRYKYIENMYLVVLDHIRGSPSLLGLYRWYPCI